MATWPALDVDGLAPDRPAAGDARNRVGSSELLQAALLDYDIAAIDETAGTRWRVFFSNTSSRDAAAASLPDRFPDLTCQPVDVPDEDWGARSQADVRAIRVGGIVVAPPWDMPSEPASAATIVIQPSMGFGTGHHATTRLCLAALQAADVRGRTVLDVGTGSGVLAIAASRLGAAQIVGIDDDADAIEAARQNLALNGIATVTLRTGDFRSQAAGAGPPSFDVVVANLTGALLTQAAGRLRDLTADASGQLVLSGFMTSEEKNVLAAFGEMGVQALTEEDGWACAILRR